MADHERGSVIGWTPDPVGGPGIAVVRQSDYLEAVAEIERLRAFVEQQNSALNDAADEIERLYERFAAAPVGELVKSHACPGDFALDAGQGVPVDISALVGKRVRLVVDGAGEGG